LKRSTYFKKRSIDLNKWVAQFPKVQTWLAKLQDKDKNSFNLWRYCQWSKKNPDQLLALKEDTKSREAEFLLDRFVADKSVKLSDHAKNNVVSAVRSFYMHNYSDLARQSGTISPMKVRPYRKPTKEDLRKLWNAAYNPRDRSLVSFVASTSIARGSLPYLKLSHFEKDWRKQEIPHIGLPASIIKGHGRGRYKNVEQHTFLTPEAKQDLIEYMEWMERKGFTFTDDVVLFRSIKRPFKPISYSELGVISDRLSEKSGVQFGWHDARRFVETALEEARIHPNWCRKIRGRKVKGEENPYSRPKVEQLRQAYIRAVPLLQFRELAQVSELDRRKQAMVDNARLMGWDDKKIEALQSLFDVCFTMEQFDRMISEGIEKKLKENEAEVDDCQKIVNEQDLEQWLTKGWRVVTTLPSGKVVVESNNNHTS